MADAIDMGITFYVCLKTFLNMLSLGKKRLKMLNEIRLIPGANMHKNMGNSNACMINDTMKSAI
jgi:hypothetical protein